MEFRYYFDIKSVLWCLLKMNKYFDMNEISKLVVNTLLWMENNLSTALIFVRDHKIKGLYEKCEI